MKSLSTNRVVMGTCGAFLFLAMLIPVAYAQTGEYSDHPEKLAGPAGKVAGAIIEAVNAKDPEKFLTVLEKFATAKFRDAFPREDHVEVFLDVCRESGGLEYFGYRTYDPPRLIAGDGLDLVPQVMNDVSDDAIPCVFHSHATY